MRRKKLKSVKVLITCTAMICTLLYDASAENITDDPQQNGDLKIYLPREVTVKEPNLTLGRISIIQGRNSLVAKANNIAIGRITVTNQNVIIDRPTVLSRLASSGIPSSMVVFQGAKETKVKRQQRIVGSRELVIMATSFLKSHPPDASVCQWSVTRKPKDLVIPEGEEEIQYSPRLVLNRIKNQAKVEITVSSAGKKIGVRDVYFTLKYNCRQAITTIPVANGTAIGPENVKIEKILSDYPEPSDWESPYGLIAKRSLTANTILRPYMIESHKSPILVKRNQSVVIRIEKPGFLITAAGISLEDGKTDEHIKIRNVDSKRIIIARIKEDGSVEPVF